MSGNATIRLLAERRAIVHACREMLAARLVVNTSGNVSLRVGSVVAITPNAVRYESMRPEDVCLVDLDTGRDDGALRPSSELPLHLAVYRSTAALAIVHTHSVYATALSTIVDRLPTIHYHAADLGGSVPVVPYATFGTDALAALVAEGLATHNAVLMRNHGATAVGPDLGRAMARAVTLEWLAEVYCHAAAVRQPALLGEADLEKAAARQRTLAGERAARARGSAR